MTKNNSTEYQIETRDNVGIFTIDREHKANSLSRPVLLALGNFAREMADRNDIRAVVITGRGSRFFCAGADLQERVGFTDIDVREQIQLYRSELGALDRCPKVVVAAINGFALGGGLEIALACDFRIASPNASFGQPECQLGIIPGAGGTQRLPKLIGSSKAKEMILFGRRVSCQQALDWGLIDQITNDAPLLNSVLDFLQPALNGAPIAIAAALEAIDSSHLPLEQGLEVEAHAYERVLCSEDRLEGIKAFVEKRSPQFRGR
ncbi:MAG: enoyl-CoA hydratase-related protein [Polyangiaceae bacterium]|nr:enoyl-CoA hydratase-related protein [Polyangiaceae bacterium]